MVLKYSRYRSFTSWNRPPPFPFQRRTIFVSTSMLNSIQVPLLNLSRSAGGDEETITLVFPICLSRSLRNPWALLPLVYVVFRLVGYSPSPSVAKVVAALKALSGLLKNHSPALLEAQQAAAASSDPPAPAPAPTDTSGTAARAQSLTRYGSIEVIARGVFEELHVPALSQSIRQV